MEAGTSSATIHPKTGSHNNKKVLVVIEARDAFREALVAALHDICDDEIVSVPGISELMNSGSWQRLKAQPQPALAMYATGGVAVSTVETEVATLKSQADLRIALLADRVDEFHSRLYQTGVIDGIILSTFGISQLQACLQTIGEGVPFMPRDFYEKVRDSGGPENGAAEHGPPAINSRLKSLLTPRQLQVMSHVAAGRSNKYIAAELDVRESTIKVHVHELMKRLGATSRTHASYIIAKMQADHTTDLIADEVGVDQGKQESSADALTWED